MAADLRTYWKQGEPLVWVTALAVGIVMVMLVGMLAVVFANGIGHFWPDSVERLTLQDGRKFYAESREKEASAEGVLRQRFKVGNRDLYGFDFVWIDDTEIAKRDVLDDVVVLERTEYGNFYGTFVALIHTNEVLTSDWEEMRQKFEGLDADRARIEALRDEMSVAAEEVAAVENKIARLEWEISAGRSNRESALVAAQAQHSELRSAFIEKQHNAEDQEAVLLAYELVFADADGREQRMPLAHVLGMEKINQLGAVSKFGIYMKRFWQLLSEDPRESNTEGGVYPAIFGTVAMVLLMSLITMPLGVVTAIYLREYARDGAFLRIVRIAVNNLAGVPSIVYGVFGLGFFIYTVGAGLDSWLYPHLAPTPVFGTGGILWASLTLSILTVPVVIVATEESLAAIPKEIREASLALGATKLQTLVRVLLPMATPGILTGFILSMARAAGEVAPLMLTGAVKMAPALPVDGFAPYVHLDRKFMHLGFHIYDLAFQSPNVEAVKPMVYVTTMLLLGIVVTLSVIAMVMRNRMQKKYSTGAF